MDWISFIAVAGLTPIFVLLSVLGIFANHRRGKEAERRKAALNPFKEESGACTSYCCRRGAV